MMLVTLLTAVSKNNRFIFSKIFHKFQTSFCYDTSEMTIQKIVLIAIRKKKNIRFFETDASVKKATSMQTTVTTACLSEAIV
jgi:hypothetical protein